MAFNGAGQYVVTTDAQSGGVTGSGLDMGTRDWMVAAWVNTTASGMVVTKMGFVIGADASARMAVDGITVHVAFGTKISTNSFGGRTFYMRSMQDWYLKCQLTAVEGVSEVASIGGFVKQYQVTVDPVKLRAYELPLSHVAMAIKRSSGEVGGIAIAIGAMVDAVIIMIENAHKHTEHDGGRKPHWQIIRDASIEVGPALFYSLLVITVSFLPVFTLQAEEGRSHDCRSAAHPLEPRHRR